MSYYSSCVELKNLVKGRSMFPEDTGWNHAVWGRIIFSDDSRFHLYPDDHRRCVWRRPGQHPDPAFTIACHTGPQQGVMVWGTL
ncbi:transposable element Tc1 transposase [Trichonephila clavipes]|nr:transposable element Tc1 transposase [Trichonephila clavipes]